MSRPAAFDDYRTLAKRRLPRVLFDYVDGGAYAETTLGWNVEAFAAIRLRQRVMRDVSEVSLSTELFGQPLSMPLLLGPVGMAGFYARRGEAQAAWAAAAAGVPFCLSTLSVCGVEEVAAASPAPPWFQLYMIKDRGYMDALMARARAHASPVLVFTVDLPVPGTRYRDVRSGLTGGLNLRERLARGADGLAHPAWLWDVMVRGGPARFGNVAEAIPNARGTSDFWVWVRENFDPSVTWKDLAWVRERWKGPIVIKGVLEVEDARAALDAGADGIVVSNHGGRQLDGVMASISALPAIAEAVGDRTTVLMDGGVRSGLDVVKALALGARACLIGRAWAMPLAARGGAGVAHMLELMRQEIAVALALAGCRDVRDAGRDLLA